MEGRREKRDIETYAQEDAMLDSFDAPGVCQNTPHLSESAGCLQTRRGLNRSCSRANIFMYVCRSLKVVE